MSTRKKTFQGKEQLIIQMWKAGACDGRIAAEICTSEKRIQDFREKNGMAQNPVQLREKHEIAMPPVGQTVYKIPSYLKMEENEKSWGIPPQAATVVYVNRRHLFYVAEYENGIREAFKAI